MPARIRIVSQDDHRVVIEETFRELYRAQGFSEDVVYRPARKPPLTREVITPPPPGPMHPGVFKARVLISLLIVTSSLSMFVHELLRW